jgi:hypothetical protein
MGMVHTIHCLIILLLVFTAMLRRIPFHRTERLGTTLKGTHNPLQMRLLLNPCVMDPLRCLNVLIIPFGPFELIQKREGRTAGALLLVRVSRTTAGN